MLQGQFVRPLALISTAIAAASMAPALAQNGPALPPLPAPAPATTEINQLEQESASLSQEARDLGGGQTIGQAADNLRSDFYQKQAQAEDLEQLARDMGYTEDELRAEQRRIAQSGHSSCGIARARAASTTAGPAGVAAWGVPVR